MKKRMGSLVASTAALTVLSLISAGGGFSSAGASPPTVGIDGLVAQANSTGTATLLGTTTLGTGTTAFGGAPVPSGGNNPLTPTAYAGFGPRTPDAGTDASSAAKAPASLSTSNGRGHPSGVPYATVTGSPVVGASSGLVTTSGLSAYDQGITHPQGASGLPGVDVEPSDQGLCASSTNTVEINNTVVSVYSGSSTTPVTLAPLESLFMTPEIFGTDGGPSLSVQGDPRCFYDSATSRWYASQIWLDENDATPQGWAGTYLAVSQTSDPTGMWNVYFIPDLSNQTGTSTCNNLPASSANSNPCFGDQPLLGVDGNSVQISTNEYSIFGNAPAGQDNYYFLSKSAVDSGAASVPVWWNALGATVAAPGGGSWYSVDPAQAPDGSYLSDNGGTSYALSALDFTNAGDSRIAEWAFTNTSAVDSSGSIGIYEITLSSGLYGLPPLAAQKLGPTPLGNFWNALNGAHSKKALPEGPIQTNDDRMTTAAFDTSTGALIGALNTGVNQAAGGKSSRPFTGVAYFVVTPSLSSTGLDASPVATGYISPSGADAFFPAVAIAPNGNGVINYVMTGTGYYPSTAYSLVSAHDTVSSAVHVAAAGAGPQDGFTEYQTPLDQRWGDYSGSQVVGNEVVFAAEMINQSCTNAQFQADFTCGGTRDLFINWGTSVNWITP
jgi:hypothetical protein